MTPKITRKQDIYTFCEQNPPEEALKFLNSLDAKTLEDVCISPVAFADLRDILAQRERVERRRKDQTEKQSSQGPKPESKPDKKAEKSVPAA